MFGAIGTMITVLGLFVGLPVVLIGAGFAMMKGGAGSQLFGLLLILVGGGVLAAFVFGLNALQGIAGK